MGAVTRRARAGEDNGDPFDRFTLLHLASGAMMHRRGWGLGGVVLAGLAFELVEDALKTAAPEAFPNATLDTKENALGDVLALVVGWYLGG